jgi:hypothetical protein
MVKECKKFVALINPVILEFMQGGISLQPVMAWVLKVLEVCILTISVIYRLNQ